MERTRSASHTTCPVGRVFLKNYSRKAYYILILYPYVLCRYAFKRQVQVFAGQVKIVGPSSCETSAILKYLCPDTKKQGSRP